MERDLRLGVCSINKRKQSDSNYDNTDHAVVLSSLRLLQEGKYKSNKKKRNNDDDVLPDFSLEKCSTANNEGSSKNKKKNPRLKKGDVVNLSELLFTKDRDFLITCNDRNRPVSYHYPC